MKFIFVNLNKKKINIRHCLITHKSKIKEDYQIEIPYWRTSLKSMIQTIQ